MSGADFSYRPFRIISFHQDGFTHISLYMYCHNSRTDSKRKHYIGAICGLGYDPETNYSILPDHDLEIEFDTEIDVADISKV